MRVELGNQSPIEIVDGQPPQVVEKKERTKPLFEQGLQHYDSREFGKAKECFQGVLRDNPQDRVAELYHLRATYCHEHGVPANWDSTDTLEYKSFA